MPNGVRWYRGVLRFTGGLAIRVLWQVRSGFVGRRDSSVSGALLLDWPSPGSRAYDVKLDAKRIVQNNIDE